MAGDGPDGSGVHMTQIGHEEASPRKNRRSIQSIWRSQWAGVAHSADRWVDYSLRALRSRQLRGETSRGVEAGQQRSFSGPRSLPGSSH